MRSIDRLMKSKNCTFVQSSDQTTTSNKEGMALSFWKFFEMKVDHTPQPLKTKQASLREGTQS